MKIIFLGVQGSGKGTQAKLLSEKFKWPHINVGEEFRENIKNKTEVGKIAEKYIQNGELVPDEYVFKMIEPSLKKAKNGFILDGFPRNKIQAKYLLKDFKIDFTLFLQLSDKKAISRIEARRHCSKCGKDYNLLYNPPQEDGICDVCGSKLLQREDDQQEAIEKRMKEFHKTTKKIIPILKKNSKFITIDADRPLEVIHKEIVKKIKQ
ncbi:MAG: nucleoside monophosphate kinase [Candidatus Cloacimonadota bacterium]|nr:nucleoside monophosphate kinase [Candidatus Cloacimonadota bacterium]